MVDFSGLATQAGDVRYGSQLSALQRALQESQRKNAQDISATDIYGTKGPSAIGGAYDALDTTLAENRTAVNNQLTGIAGNIDQGYKDASKMYGPQQWATGMESAYANHAADAQNALDRMLFNNETVAARAKGDMQSWAGQMDSINAKGQTVASNMRADALGRFQTELLDSLSNLRLQGTKDTNEYNAQISDVHSERGNFIATEMARLAAEEWQRQLAIRQLEQEAAIAAAQIAAQDRATSASSSRGAADDSLEWAKFAYGKDQDALDRAMAEKQYANDQAAKNNFASGDRATILGNMANMTGKGSTFSIDDVNAYAKSIAGMDPAFGASLQEQANAYGQGVASGYGRLAGNTLNKYLSERKWSGGGNGGGFLPNSGLRGYSWKNLLGFGDN